MKVEGTPRVEAQRPQSQAAAHAAPKAIERAAAPAAVHEQEAAKPAAKGKLVDVAA